MAIKIGSLLIDINTNLANLQAQMKKADKAFNGTLHKMEAGLKAFAGAAAAAFTVDKIATFIDDTIDAADEVARLAKETGLTAEALTRFQHAAAVSGVPVEALNQAFRDLGDRLGDAALGNKSWLESFQQIGIGATEVQALAAGPLSEAFLRVSDALANAESPAKRLHAAMEIFSDTGSRLIPLFKLGSERIKEMGEESDRLGFTLSTETTLQAREFNKNMAALGDTIRGVANDIISKLLPALSGATKAMVEGKEATTGFGDFIGEVMTSAMNAARTAWFLIERTVSGILTIPDVISANLQGDFQAARDVQTKWGNDTIERLHALGRVVETTSKEVADAPADASAAINMSFANMSSEAGHAAEVAAAALRDRVVPAAKAVATNISVATDRTRDLADAAAALADSHFQTRLLMAQAGGDERDSINLRLGKQLDEINAAEAAGTIAHQDAENQRVAATKIADQQIIDINKRTAAERGRIAAGTTQKVKEEQQKTVDDSAQKGLGIASALTQGLRAGFESDSFQGVFKSLLSVFGRIAGILSPGGIAGGVFDLFAGLFAEGGLVGGIGTGTSDSNLALVSRGEFINTAAAVRTFGARFFERLNEGVLDLSTLRRFAVGGMVGASMAAAAPVIAGAPSAPTQIYVTAFDPRSMAEVIGQVVEPVQYRRGVTRSSAKLIAQQRRSIRAPRTGR